MDIENIPDYPALMQLSRALWREGTVRGAALFVGAGFSKNAERPAADTPSPPLWTDFADSMAEHLYPLNKAKLQINSLQLAEEYRAYFGRAALDELVRTHISDAAWQPGALHRELLSLEWSDVLTTNWDTLLERTAETIGSRPYHIVRSESDLAHTRSPRIVKLHGSLGTSEHFILTEEDYRTYPILFAAFVNFARQIFIENELCLVGFSGDDPNFLQWSGWVRDNLGGSARRIYLVGVLDMAPSKRKLLEARNIMPIDLGPLVDDEPDHRRHEVAMRTFVRFLAKNKPKPVHDWKPSSIEQYDFLSRPGEDIQRRSDPTYQASILNQAAEIWKRDRKTYPGWLVCPWSIRNEIVQLTDICSINTLIINALSPDRKAEVLYEIAWRKEISLVEIDSDLASQLSDIAYPKQNRHLTHHQSIEVAVLLLKTARRSGDDLAFATFSAVLATQAEDGTDLHAELAFQRALKARDNMDFSTVKAEVDIMVGQDPIWLLRRAALLFEVGELNTATEFVFDAQLELENRQRRDQSSLWIKSRRAWAEWIGRASRIEKDLSLREAQWPLSFKGANCDPGEEVDRLTNIFARELREFKEQTFSSIPPFQAGHYRVRSKDWLKRTKYNSRHLTTLNQLMEIVGLPMRLNYVDLVTKAALDASQMSFEGTAKWYIWVLRALNVPWGDVFEKYFSRIEIACLSIKDVDVLSCNIKSAVLYWSNRVDSDVNFLQNARGKLRLLIEVLARLTVRQDSLIANSHLSLTESIVNRPWANDVWLYEPLSNLLENSIQSLPYREQENAVKFLLSFPLSYDTGHFSTYWPEPTHCLWWVKVNRNPWPDWNNLISRMIDAAAPASHQRPAAILRLSYLFRNKALDDIELDKFGNVLWAETDKISGLPSNTTLLAYMFSELPAPDGIDKYKLVTDHLFNINIEEIFLLQSTLDSREIYAKIHRLQGLGCSVPGIVRPTREQATKLFDSIVKWRMPNLTGLHSLSNDLLSGLHGRSGRLLGDIIVVVVQVFHQEDLTAERARAIIAFVSEVEACTATGALPYFLNHDEVLASEIVSFINQGIVARTAEEVFGSTRALELWVSSKFQAEGKSLPLQLIDRIVTSIETGRETGLLNVLSCLLKLIEADVLLECDILRVSHALGEMLSEYQYQKIDPESRQANIVSLVRAECRKIAYALKERSSNQAAVINWLIETDNDPLPEVRFALEINASQTL